MLIDTSMSVDTATKVLYVPRLCCVLILGHIDCVNYACSCMYVNLLVFVCQRASVMHSCADAYLYQNTTLCNCHCYRHVPCSSDKQQ